MRTFCLAALVVVGTAVSQPAAWGYDTSGVVVKVACYEDTYTWNWGHLLLRHSTGVYNFVIAQRSGFGSSVTEQQWNRVVTMATARPSQFEIKNLAYVIDPNFYYAGANTEFGWDP